MKFSLLALVGLTQAVTFKTIPGVSLLQISDPCEEALIVDQEELNI